MRLVLRETLTRADVEEAIYRRGWRLANILPASELEPLQIVALSADRESRFRFFHDPRLGAYWVTIQGGDVAAREAEIRDALPCYTDQDIRELLESASPDDYSRGVHFRVLASRPEEPAEAAEVIAAALQHAEPAVRDAAISSALCLGGQEALTLLRPVAAEDPDPGVRRRAKELCDAMSPGDR